MLCGSLTAMMRVSFYHKYFDPLPVEVIALVLAVVGISLVFVSIALIMSDRSNVVSTSGQQV